MIQKLIKSNNQQCPVKDALVTFPDARGILGPSEQHSCVLVKFQAIDEHVVGQLKFDARKVTSTHDCLCVNERPNVLEVTLSHNRQVKCDMFAFSNHGVDTSILWAHGYHFRRFRNSRCHSRCHCRS